MSYLATITKGCNTMNEVTRETIDDFVVCYGQTLKNYVVKLFKL